MTEWRSKGYVQDSDDDVSISDSAAEEDVDQALRSLHNATTPTHHGHISGISRQEHGEAAAAGVQTLTPDHESRPTGKPSLSQDFEDIDELQRETTVQGSPILRRRSFSRSSPPAASKDIFDVPSSPPEDPQQRSIATPASSDQEVGTADQRQFQASQASGKRTSPVVVIPSLQDTREEAPANGRTFRQRNPIQLHPYLLENEAYRKTLRKAGERPIHVQAQQRRQQQESLDDDTQWQEQDADIAGVPTDAEDSSDIPYSSPPLQPQSHHSMPDRESWDDADELPSLEDMLRRPLDDGVPRGVKRQKVSHNATQGKASVHSLSTGSSPGLGAPQEQTPHTLASSTARIRKTGGKLKHAGLKQFRLPSTVVPAHLPTPGPSSDNDRYRRDTEHFESEGSGDEQLLPAIGRRRQDSVSRARSASASSSSSSSDPETHVKQMTKRIKGVLPASWLRLDQQASKPKPRSPIKRSHTDWPSTEDPQRGMAKRIIHRSSVTSPVMSTTVLNVSDDSADEDAGVPAPIERTKSTLDPNAPLGSVRHVDTQDLEEDDWVDPMLPTMRRRHHFKKSSKRQVRLADAFAQQGRSSNSIEQRPREDRAATSTQASRSKRKRAPRQTKFSIVDAVHEAQRESVPDFIRVAARRVRKRADHGRHSPSKKQISFHNIEDTEAVGRRLDEWQRGRLKRWRPAPTIKAKPHPISRPALQEQTSNHQNRLPSPVKLARNAPEDSKKANISSAEDATPLTKRVHSGKPRQTRLQAVPVPRLSSTTRERPSAGKSLAGEERRRRADRQLKAAFCSRPGQLEDFREQDQSEHPQDAFDGNLYDLNDEYSHRHQFEQRPVNPLLERFLSPGDEHVMGRIREARTPGTKLPRKRRSHQAPKERGPVIRLDYEEYFPAEAQPLTPAEGTQLRSTDSLQGLQRYGASYTTDFGVAELPSEAYFHSNTFIGSCEFQDALSTSKRSVDERADGTAVTLQSRTRFWGAWNEEVASDVRQIFAELNDGGEGQPPSTKLRVAIKYVAKSLHFLDDPDRQSFVQQMTSNIKMALDPPPNRLSSGHVTTFIATLAYQIRCIASSPVVSPEARKEADQGLLLAVQALAGYIIRQHGQIQTVYQDFCQKGISGHCLTNEAVTVENVVALHHLLRSADIPGLSAIGAIFAELMSLDPASFILVDQFEHAWSTLFHVMPFLSFDEQGIVRKSENLTASSDWSLVKAMLTRLFDLYSKASTANGSTINAYMRANMARCCTLVCTWKWQNAEPVLGCMFDFFAKAGFACLQREGSRGSPAFLEHLDRNLAPLPNPVDRSFDIFLKLLASCLRRMRSRYPSKKMKNLIWRFIPNHGRRLDKEADLREDDLDAIRNQHNLLCVLYWVSPTEARVDCNHLRKIVNVKSSHAEVVRIHIRTWTNLVRYQLSSEEDVSSLEPFAAWFSALLQDLISLHRMARTEAEATFSANASTGVAMSSNLRESVIDKNERQVEGLLTMMLVSMSALLSEATISVKAKALFEQSSLSSVLSLFDPENPRLLNHVSLALDSYRGYFKLCVLPRRSSAQQSSDDSQDFGDWDDIEALADDSDSRTDDGKGFGVAFDQMHQLLSNCFGADGFFDDPFLTKTLDIWVTACHTSIQLGQRHWAYFLDSQSNGSWLQLRDTQQRRAYWTLFLAQVMASDKQAYEDNLTTVVSAWVSSLVERESLLKYQHSLTNAILNTDRDISILYDLPFATSDGSEKYDVSLAELRERRLSLISTLLGNIRQSCECPYEQDSDRMQRMRQEYSSLLRNMMAEMKRVYLETQQGSSLRGGYVGFVQQVVQLLQQNTADIVMIDKFFTDSGAFPLPATDPTYVVGRLKSYRRTLSDERSQKKLTLFLQTTCERAAADNQQAYLVEQLTLSVQGLWEDSKEASPSLRSLLLEALFPCYLGQMFSSECGWIIAVPILEATSRLCIDLAHCFDHADRKISSALCRLLAALTNPMRAAVAQIAANQALLNHAHVSSTLRAILATATSMLPLVDFLYRLTDDQSQAVDNLKYMHAFAYMLDRTSRSMPLPDGFDLNSEQYQQRHDASDTTSQLQSSSKFQSLATFCTRELKDSLSKNWVRHETVAGGVEYFLIRGRDRKEIIVDLATPEKEVEDLLGVVEEFGRVWRRMPGLRELDPWTWG